MKWVALLAGIASMKAAFERGDLDEAARQGATAGIAIVEDALAATDRSTVLAGIVAAPEVEDRIELLPKLAALASGPDRRIAIPAARAAATIAKRSGHVTDDVAVDDLAEARAPWIALAMRGDRWIEVRVAALEVAAAIDDLDLAPIMKDPDPVLRATAIELVPLPASEATMKILADAIANDTDAKVALDAARVACPDLATIPPAVAARVKVLIANDRSATAAKRCLR